MSAVPFDEKFYLDANPDVAEAVRSGTFGSGYEHYVQFGASEGRKPVRPVEDLLSSSTTDMVFLELTSRCNLRCVYCMPLEGVAWLPHGSRAGSSSSPGTS